MNYFKLYPTVKLIETNKNACLYDFINGFMIKLDKSTSELLNKCNLNNEIEKSPENMEKLKKLEELKLGFFTDKVIYQEDFENTDIDLRKIILPNTNIINKVFIELGSECNLDCIFCNRDDNLFRKTGCKKWTRYESKLTMNNWDKVLADLSTLDAKQLCFIGGNPIIRIKDIDEIITKSKKYGFNMFALYSNATLIDDDVIKIIKENNIILNLQILSFNKDTLLKLGLTAEIAEEIRNTLSKLVELHVNFGVQILVNKFNEDEIYEIQNILKNQYNIRNISVDYIYKNTKNKYYSEKHVENMYTKSFTKVTKEKFNSLQMWNPCFKGQISIRESGEVTICPMMRQSFGNVLESEICDILSGKEYNEYISITKSSIDKCKECSYQYNCIDCRAIEVAATNNLYGLEYCKED